MLNQPRKNIVRLLIAQGALAALLGITLGCGASSLAGPTPTPVTPAPVAVPGAYTITAGAQIVAPGGPLSVTWTASPSYCCDWIALFRVSDKSSAQAWVKSTEGATSGTFTLIAPTQAGQYEFRYLLEDERDVARSSIVTVGT